MPGQTGFGESTKNTWEGVGVQNYYTCVIRIFYKSQKQQLDFNLKRKHCNRLYVHSKTWVFGTKYFTPSNILNFLTGYNRKSFISEENVA